MIIAENDLDSVDSLYKKGLYLQAYNLAQSICPLPKWEGTKAKLMAAHLAMHLGAPKSCRRWTTEAWRRDRHNAEAKFYYALELHGEKGHIPALIFLKKQADEFAADAKLTAWWQSLHAQVYANLRDFETAEEWLGKAFETAPDESWNFVVRAHILELQDRYAEALVSARQALETNPMLRSGVQATAHLLVLLEKYDEALGLLSEASSKFESAWTMTMLANLQTELGLYNDARSSLERIAELTPMREDTIEQWLYGMMSDAAYHCGDLEKAIRYADVATTPFFEKIRDNLKKVEGPEKRVLLSLDFVRQHHMTCAPATLSTISRFWKKQAEHLSIAEEICYDGTPAYNERNWAEKNGWTAQEFTVTWETAVQLIDRGVPFTLATVHPGGGHLQAVIGYDERRCTFLIRDPYYHQLQQMLASELLEEQKAWGPRGMALVPGGMAHLLEDLDFFEAREHDLLHLINNALAEFNRDCASEILARMQAEFPAHQLTWRAKWALAAYDSNCLEIADCVENLLALYPDDVNLKMSKFSAMRDHTQREERLAELNKWSKDKKTSAYFWQMYGYELGLDARHYKDALKWIYKSVRAMPHDGVGLRCLADLLWGQREFAVALELYRFAACLQNKNEQMATSYFIASRHLKQTEKALSFLQDRFCRFAHLSELPVRTLFHALRELGRTTEAFRILDEGLKKRPADSALKLFAADAKARYGQLDEAAELLAQTENQTARGAWLRSAASVRWLQGDLKTALKYWQEVGQLEPLARDAHENIAQFMAEIDGKDAARNYLRGITAKFPEHCELHKLRLNWLQNEPEEAETVVRHLIEIDARDAWGYRELARLLLDRKQFDEALLATETALALDPNEPSNTAARAYVLSEMHRTQEAAEEFQKTLRLSIDADYALRAWLNICHTTAEKLAALKFAHQELRQQVTFGEGLMGYREQACLILDPAELLDNLQVLHKEREDLWAAWSVLISQLVSMHRLEEALPIAQSALEKFPLNPRLWFDLSQIYKIKGETEKEIESLQKALKINSVWSYAAQQLVEAYQRTGQFEEARELLVETIKLIPLDYYLYGYLADILWQLGDKETALENAKRAIELEPTYDWGWRAVQTWGAELGKADEAAKLARKLVNNQQNSISAHLTLARMLADPEQHCERLAILDRALEIDSQNVAALGLKARTLADEQRVEEALAVCQTKLADGHQPEQLRYIAAQIVGETGRVTSALEQLEKLIEDSPDYYPAWERLAAAYRNYDEKSVDYLRVTREMARLAPQDPVVFGYLGEAYLRNNDRQNAKKALAQAITLEPNYEFANYLLFDLNFEDNERDASFKILQNMQNFLKDDPDTFARESFFYARETDVDKTKAAWKKLVRHESASKYLLEQATKAILDSKIPKPTAVVSALLEHNLREPGVNPIVGALWVEYSAASDLKKCERELAQLNERNPVWHAAARAFLTVLIDGRLHSKARSFIKKYEQDLRSETETWASVGYTLNCLKDYKWACTWFEDWRTRADVRPWMLWNFVLSLRRLKKIEIAQIVSQRALEIEYDETVNTHRTFLGLDAAWSENFGRAETQLAQIDSNALTEWEKYFYLLLQFLFSVKAEAENNSKDYNLALKEMLETSLAQPSLWSDHLMRESFNKTLSQALRHNQNLWQKLWINLRVWFSFLRYRLNKSI